MARATKPPVRTAAWASAVSTSPDIDESVYVATGFPAPAGVPVVPTRGEFNYEFNRYDTGGVYLFQHGISDWDTNETDYAAFDILRDPVDGKFYQLIGTATPGTAPHLDPTNWYLCLRVPRPMTGETVEDPIAAWSNAKGFPITGKDHYGFDAGRILDFREDWMDGASAQKTATAVSTLWFGRWNYAIDNGGGTAGLIAANGPWQADLNTHPWGPLLGVNAFGQSVNAVSIVETVKAITKMSAASLIFEVDFSINGASGPQTHTYFALGLGDGTIAANRTIGNMAGATAYGAWIQGNLTASANWVVASLPNGGVAVGTDSGVAITKDVPHRYRCVILGTSDDDGSTARVIHLIDGVEVGNQLTSLNNQMLSPFVRVYADQGEVCVLNVGPMRIQSRLALGAVLI
jgi:hypothetical protein